MFFHRHGDFTMIALVKHKLDILMMKKFNKKFPFQIPRLPKDIQIPEFKFTE